MTSPPPGWRPLDSGFWQPPDPPPPLDADKLRAHLAELTPDEQREAAIRYMITYTAVRPAPLAAARYAVPDAEPEAELPPPDPAWLRNVLLLGALALIGAITAALIIWPNGLGQR